MEGFEGRPGRQGAHEYLTSIPCPGVIFTALVQSADRIVMVTSATLVTTSQYIDPETNVICKCEKVTEVRPNALRLHHLQECECEYVD